MRNICRASTAALSLAFAGHWAAAAVYKCTDAAGKTAYQAQPCPESGSGSPLKLDGQTAPRSLTPSRTAAPPQTEPSSSWRQITEDGELAAPAGAPPAPAPRAMPLPERVQVPLVRLSFNLLSPEGRRLAWTNAGPRGGSVTSNQVRDAVMGVEQGGQVVVDASGREAYALGSNGGKLVWMPRGLDGPQQELTPPAKLPSLSWASAMAWDTRNGVLAIASFGGEGFFYRYDTRRHAWLGAVSLRNRDLLTLAFDAVTGSFVGLSDQKELVIYDAHGGEQSVRSLDGVLPDHGPAALRSRQVSLHLVVRDGVVAIVKLSGTKVTHIWTYALVSGIAQLTYKD